MIETRGPFLVALLVAELMFSLGNTAGAGEKIVEPAGYRLGNYRAPVPDAAAGAVTVTTRQLAAMVETGKPVLIDVLPTHRKPEGMRPGAPWLPIARHDIPGSVWLPEVGSGKLSDSVDLYFRKNLAKATDGNRGRALVIYCLPKCWMSWNAAKRAAAYGYTSVYWYPDGTDGWEAEGLPLEPNSPVPLALPISK